MKFEDLVGKEAIAAAKKTFVGLTLIGTFASCATPQPTTPVDRSSPTWRMDEYNKRNGIQNNGGKQQTPQTSNKRSNKDVIQNGNGSTLGSLATHVENTLEVDTVATSLYPWRAEPEYRRRAEQAQAVKSTTYRTHFNNTEIALNGVKTAMGYSAAYRIFEGANWATRFGELERRVQRRAQLSEGVRILTGTAADVNQYVQLIKSLKTNLDTQLGYADLAYTQTMQGWDNHFAAVQNNSNVSSNSAQGDAILKQKRLAEYADAVNKGYDGTYDEYRKQKELEKKAAANKAAKGPSGKK